MKGIVLRERTDCKLNAVIRLRRKDNGDIRYTIQQFDAINGKIQCLEKPLFAHIRLTNRCNLNCSYCYAEDGQKHTDMNEEQVMNLIDKCIDNQIFHITWTGGEPLLHPR
ncbi:radical SAM protein [Bacteroides heparinolyticus]|uniref:radical SAM protein n=1 Tax=Prevotella heparinolytica TaxID=28113 RepID=UPI0035A0F3DF